MSNISCFQMPPSISLAQKAAKAAVFIFQSYNLTSCLIGGLACQLYGNDGTAEELEILVVSTYTHDDLKSILQCCDSRFYSTITATRHPPARYLTLWFGTAPSASSSSKCRITIFTPTNVDIVPSVPTSAIIKLNGIPTAPLSSLLLLKLKDWEQHRNAIKAHLQAQQTADEREINFLLQLALAKSDVRPTENAFHSEVFVHRSKCRARDYANCHPDTRGGWEALGLLDVKIGGGGRGRGRGKTMRRGGATHNKHEQNGASSSNNASTAEAPSAQQPSASASASTPLPASGRANRNDLREVMTGSKYYPNATEHLLAHFEALALAAGDSQ